jgi:hypothetical protein
MVQKGTNAATVSVSKVSVSSLQHDHLDLRAAVTFAGPLAGYAARVRAFSAEVYVDGTKVGHCQIPEFELPFGAPAHIALETRLKIDSHPSSQRLSNSRPPVLAASPGAQWEVRGSTDLVVLGQTVKLNIAKVLELPGGIVSDIQARRLDIISGSKSELLSSIDVHFSASSVVEIEGSGAIAFSIHTFAKPHTELGTAYVPNFRLSSGENTIQSARVSLSGKTGDAVPFSKALATLLGQWASGVPQDLIVRGPYMLRNGSLQPLHWASIEKRLTIHGLSSGLLKSTYIDNYYSILGHKPYTGDNCPYNLGAECFRGALNVVESGFSRDVRLRDLSIDVDLLEPLAYDTRLHGIVAIPIKKVSCPRSSHVTRLFSAAGMSTLTNRSRAHEDFITLHGNTRREQELTSFFLPGKPQPGQAAGSTCLGDKDYDCCFKTVLSAAACYNERNSASVIPVSLSGNLTLVVDDFFIAISFVQRSSPIIFEKDMTHLKSGLVSMSCEDFRFH